VELLKHGGFLASRNHEYIYVYIYIYIYIHTHTQSGCIKMQYINLRLFHDVFFILRNK
jgi:hypothetical protein